MSTYDAWKLRSPDDEYQDLAPYCDHEEYEIDVCMGRAECQICGERWWVTKEQVDAECERIADYDAWCRAHARSRGIEGRSQMIPPRLAIEPLIFITAFLMLAIAVNTQTIIGF